ncbi:GAF and ANTAR domain-containing protein [Streptomyces sp. NPDC047117]|uniref:GAF and ANTAR domain-containing protein n=1 Tax=unclassified Streptomyces TaxID=2593676 RepID=UPI0033D88353
MSTDREQRLAETFIRLSDTLSDDFDLVEFFQTLTDRCVELLDIASAVLFLTRPSDDFLHPCAWTPVPPHKADLLVTAATDSPMTRAHHTAETVLAVDLARVSGPQSDFANEARKAGYTHAAALPLRLRERALGALLTLHTREPAGKELRLARALTDQAAVGLVHRHRFEAETTLNSQLYTALHSRVLIEQAKGVLSVHLHCSIPEAFEAIRRHARSSRRPLTAVAADVIDRGLRPRRNFTDA